MKQLPINNKIIGMTQNPSKIFNSRILDCIRSQVFTLNLNDHLAISPADGCQYKYFFQRSCPTTAEPAKHG